MDKNDPRRQPTDEELDALNEHWVDPGDPDGVIEAEQEKKWRELHPVPVTAPKQRRRHPWLKALLLLVLLAAATVGAYWFGNRQASAPAPKAHTSTSSTVPKQTQAEPVTTTKHYDSVTYTIGFDYPESWKLTDTTTKLTVASPSMLLKTADGKSVSTHVLFTVRNKQTVISEFADGPASATLPSEKLTYKKPTAIQRAQTYISFLSFAKSQSGSLDAVYVTGDSGYTQDQAIPMADVVKGDPLINVTFVGCPTDDCATGTLTPYSVASTTWKDSAVGKPVTALLESLTLN